MSSVLRFGDAPVGLHDEWPTTICGSQLITAQVNEAPDDATIELKLFFLSWSLFAFHRFAPFRVGLGC